MLNLLNQRQGAPSGQQVVVGIHVLLIRSLFDDGILRRLFWRVSLVKSTSGHKASHALTTSGCIGSLPEIQPTFNSHTPRPGRRLTPTHF